MLRRGPPCPDGGTRLTSARWAGENGDPPTGPAEAAEPRFEHRPDASPRRLRIGIVVPGFHAYPDEPFVPYWGAFVARLARRAHVTVFALRRPQKAFEFHGAAVVPVGAGDPPLSRSPMLWMRAARLVAGEARSRRLDVLHALYANEVGMVAGIASVQSGVPCLVHVGGGELPALPDNGYGAATVPAERFAVSLALSLTAAVTAGSLEMVSAAAAHRTVARRRVPVLRIPFAVDPDQFHAADVCPAPVFSHVADMNRVKDQECLIVALAILARDRPGIALHWVGDGPRCGALRSLARELNVDHRIRWWGRVPHTVVASVYARSAAFVLSSRHEAQGVVLTEAACSGLPIAATAVGVAPELLPSGTHIARTRDPMGLAVAMQRALETSTATRQRLREGAIARFGRATVDRRLDTAYRRVVAGTVSRA